MSWTKASAVAEILSSVAILVTLIYLVIEIGQNTTALEATARQASLDNEVEYLYQFVDTPDLWLSMVDPELTPEEQVRLSAALSAFMRMRERDWLQYQAGALDERTWSTFQTGMLYFLSLEQPRGWWNSDVTYIFDPAFVSYVNSQLEDQPIIRELRTW